MNLNPYEPIAHVGVPPLKYPTASRGIVQRAFLRGLRIGALLGFVLGASTGIAIFSIFQSQDQQTGFREVHGVIAVVVSASTVLAGLMGTIGFGAFSALGRLAQPPYAAAPAAWPVIDGE